MTLVNTCDFVAFLLLLRNKVISWVFFIFVLKSFHLLTPNMINARFDKGYFYYSLTVYWFGLSLVSNFKHTKPISGTHALCHLPILMFITLLYQLEVCFSI